jgi:predicted DNA-binding protein (MmcQ/YjbR family)
MGRRRASRPASGSASRPARAASGAKRAAHRASKTRPGEPAYDRALAKLREICLALPETTEVVAWGHPTFRVKDKIFAGFGIEDGRVILGFKADGLEQQELVETEPDLYYVAKYVGKHGWVSMRVDGEVDWKRVKEHVLGSFRRIAPAKLKADR